MGRLARVKRAAGDRAGARHWFRRALEGQRVLLPAGHPSAAETLAGLGAALLEDGEAAAAEPLLREALALASERLLPRQVTRAEASAALGDAFLAQRRHAEAEPLLVAAHEGFQASRGSGHPSTVRTRQRLVRLYDGWGRPSDAARYRVHPPPRPAPDTTR
jgi:tetratricopeptide (TPR) repeat protein